MLRLVFGDYVKILDDGFWNGMVGRVIDCRNDVSWGSGNWNPIQTTPLGGGSTTLSLDMGTHYTIRFEKDGLVHQREFIETSLEKLNAAEYMRARKKNEQNK